MKKKNDFLVRCGDSISEKQGEKWHCHVIVLSVSILCVPTAKPRAALKEEDKYFAKVVPLAKEETKLDH